MLFTPLRIQFNKECIQWYGLYHHVDKGSEQACSEFWAYNTQHKIHKNEGILKQFEVGNKLTRETVNITIHPMR